MSLAAFADEPILLSLYHYWKRKRAARRMPARKDIDPGELTASVLPYLALAEFVETLARLPTEEADQCE